MSRDATVLTLAVLVLLGGNVREASDRLVGYVQAKSPGLNDYVPD